MDSRSTPRITADYLQSYVGKNVMIVGKVAQLRGEEAVIDAGGNITVHLNRDAYLQNGNGAQLLGKVNPDLTVKVLTSLDLGPNVDYKLANSVAEISQRHKQLFSYDTN
ncbi:replication factor A protein 3 [Thozetella sp. PMI_491]|nr:replication factor A protein 3 [Thozetella sp. PMI_491]